ncbi:MAG: hypothetical protein KDI19_12045 [Pseudomonadales bacterium]|nr:hypothetical protein [Pseudomonadales bacterium]
MRKAFVYGAGHLGRQVLHHLWAYYGDSIEILGFVDDVRAPGEEVLGGLQTLGPLECARDDARLGPHAAGVVFAVGYSSMTARHAALDRVVDAGYGLLSVVHPQAIVEPGTEIGAGAIILGGAVVDQQVTLGMACFVDIGVRLGAGTTVGHNNYFSSGTCTGSRVSIGQDCFFGMNCTITTDVRIGDNVFVNAAALVPRDLGSNLKVVELRKSRELPQR